MSASAALTLEQGVAQLAAIVGEEHTRLRGETAQTIEVAPGDMQQVAEMLRFAHANALSVMPSGGGTKLGWGNTLTADIELSMKRLNQLREHAWQDMTCTVQAGCSWTAMQDALKTHGQMVALDPLCPERATVGGIVACNDSGALRLKYGGLRDLIIGMTMVLADGTIAKSGGKVVKNVAGYDMHKLLTGSFGTLGVIAEVNFRLHPVEEHRQTWTAVGTGAVEAGPAASSLAEPLRALMDSQTDSIVCATARVQGRVRARHPHGGATGVPWRVRSAHPEYIRDPCDQGVWGGSLERAAATLRRQRCTGAEGLSASQRNMSVGCGIAAMDSR